MAGARNSHIHTTVVFEEAKSVRSHCRNDDDIFLTTLVAIDCVDFYVRFTVQIQPVANLADSCPNLPYL